MATAKTPSPTHRGDGDGAQQNDVGFGGRDGRSSSPTPPNTQDLTAAQLDLLITVVRKNSREEFRITLRKYKGRTFIDFRVHANNGTDIVPTPKGVAIMPEKLGAIIAGLQEAERAAIEAGLIEPNVVSEVADDCHNRT